MVEEKVKFISKELPVITSEISKTQEDLTILLAKEKELVENINKSGSFDELEGLVLELNEKHRKKGEFEAIINQIEKTEKNIEELNAQVDAINNNLFSDDFELEVQSQVNKFNKYFSTVSQELYGEQYALKYDIVTASKTGKKYTNSVRLIPILVQEKNKEKLFVLILHIFYLQMKKTFLVSIFC
ncbi:hypothetical protein ESCOCP284M_22195 [Escherichia coli]